MERYSNHRLSGRIYYDFNTEQDIHDFAKVVFEGTSLFKNRECGRKTNKKINPLDINKDIDIIKAIGANPGTCGVRQGQGRSTTKFRPLGSLFHRTCGGRKTYLKLPCGNGRCG